MYFCDGVPVVFGQATDAVSDVQLMLAHHGGATVAQQLVVVKQAACNGILNGRHANDRRVLGNALVDLLKRLATDELQLLTLKILMGGNVVKRPYLALYCYSLHLLILYFAL
jgi:hypothetical protein